MKRLQSLLHLCPLDIRTTWSMVGSLGRFESIHSYIGPICYICHMFSFFISIHEYNNIATNNQSIQLTFM